ncbi:hypothetical protein M436DRAFT_37168 [Aureobasidium namibiae CBS 147.97]|uniref:Centrosomin N-terminal motif 1 domain-containing protein n=1 Tax=Aureobasidium namibiae CBS 147.97 TaxID=1043004 RepID=A0A074WXL9_9PEZI
MNNPASPYLLDRLQARRANTNTRSRRSGSNARLTTPDDDLFLDEARYTGHDNLTTTPNNTHTPTNPNASLGVREIEKRMDKLSKLNFDLKLELFHCRERMAKLQENCNLLTSRAEDANRLVEENAKLLELNDSLVKELERRDEAVQEAVSIICDLEERLEQAQLSQQHPHDHLVNSTELRASSVSPCPRAILSPPKSDKSSMTQSSSARRIPSFVDDKKPNTRALRSVYLKPKPSLRAVKSFASLTSQTEDVDKSLSDVDTLDSPRLSVLSKSSFPSIYDLPRSEDAGKHQETDLALPNSQLHHISQNAGRKHDSDIDINSWIQVQTPQSFVKSSGKPLPRPRSDAARVQRPAYSTTLSQINQKRRPSLKGAAFAATSLPPTPDSASTSILQDSYMTGQPNSQHRSNKHLANASKHAALLHTPETPSIADMSKLHATKEANNPMNGAGWFNRHSMSLSSTDEEDEYYEQSDSDRTGSAGTDASYPDGDSIPKGTPSRFQIRRNVSPARSMPREGVAQLSRSGQKEEWALLPKSNEKTRFQMERSETTPNLAALQTPPASLQRNSSVSGSSSLRPQRIERSETTPNLTTAIQAATSTPFFQPGLPIKSSSSGSGGVRAALSQKTQKLFRRMSEHHTSSSEPSSRPTRGVTLSPSKRSAGSSSRSGSDESLAMQAANQTLTSHNFGAPQNGNAEARSPSRGLFSRAAGSLRR